MGAYEYIRLIKRENYNRFLDDANAFNKNPWTVKKPDIDDYLEKEKNHMEAYIRKYTLEKIPCIPAMLKSNLVT